MAWHSTPGRHCELLVCRCLHILFAVTNGRVSKSDAWPVHMVLLTAAVQLGATTGLLFHARIASNPKEIQVWYLEQRGHQSAHAFSKSDEVWNTCSHEACGPHQTGALHMCCFIYKSCFVVCLTLSCTSNCAFQERGLKREAICLLAPSGVQLQAENACRTLMSDVV